jgi:DNA-binding transcriptional LysR family regulator
MLNAEAITLLSARVGGQSRARLVTLPVEAPWLTLNYGFITKRGRTLSPAAEAFMEIVREIDSVISP